jgi:hypothetical protein
MANPLETLTGAQMRETPRKNKLAGVLADWIAKADQFARAPGGYDNPPVAMLSDALGIPAVQRTLDRYSYGEPLTTGRGMTTQLRPDTIEAAMAVGPAVAKWPKQAAGAALGLAGMADTGASMAAGLAAKAVPTGKISPITRKPIFDLFDDAGERIGSIHAASTADDAVMIASRAAELRANPAAASPPAQGVARQAAPVAPRARPAWQVAKGEQFSGLDNPDDYLYHVTTAPASRGILSDGLKPSKSQAFGDSYAGHSSGRVFLTDRNGVRFWQDRIEQNLELQHDKPPKVVVMRIPRGGVQGLQDDAAGTADARAKAYFVTGEVR